MSNLEQTLSIIKPDAVERNLENEIKEMFKHNGFSILKEIYDSNDHFDIDTLHAKMSNKKYKISKATLYNTIELLLECRLVKRHQFDSNISHYEKSYFNNQHDHLILTDTGEVIEFCDPRLHTIKQNIEEIFDVKIDNHSLYFYGKKNKS